MAVGKKKSHPGPGWKPKKVKETNQFVTHWISPTRQIVFRRRRAACNFESLRREFGTDEVEAWEVFRKQYYSKAKGHPAFVVSPQDYDAPSNNASVHQSNVQEDGQRDPSVGEDFAAHRDTDVENGSTRSAHDNGGGKHHINHISTSIRHHRFLTHLPINCTEKSSGRHTELRRDKSIRRASKKITSSKSLRPSTTSEIEEAVVSNSTRERGTSSPRTKKRNAQSNGDNSRTTKHGALSRVAGIVDTTNHDAEAESLENDELCYICDDGGGKGPNSFIEMSHMYCSLLFCIMQIWFCATTAQNHFTRTATFRNYTIFQKGMIGCAASAVQ